MDYLRYGEDGVRVLFGNAIDRETNRAVRQFYLFLASLRRREVIDIIPSFRSCLVRFNSTRTTYNEFVSFLKEREGEALSIDIPEPVLHEIPVQYGGEFGPDMEFVCAYSGLDEEQVIEIHSSTVYTVFAVGFIPGFPYMGMVDKRIYAPRLETPRLKVPEGSVGLAQLQTGIYSFESPAGWRIIGKTSVQLFNPFQEPFSLLKMGDVVRFIPV